jgi:hypothetical protein
LLPFIAAEIEGFSAAGWICKKGHQQFSIQSKPLKRYQEYFISTGYF